MDDISFQNTTFPMGRRQTSKKKKVFLFLLIILLAAGIMFGATKLLNIRNQAENASLPTPTPTEVAFPTDSPTPTIPQTPAPTSSKPSPAPKSTTTSGLDRGKLTIDVRNGSGVVGAASKASDYLKGLGYVVMTAGNADSFDFENVTVQVKPEYTNYLSLLKSDLAKEYTVSSTSADLAPGVSANARVIIGK